LYIFRSTIYQIDDRPLGAGQKKSENTFIKEMLPPILSKLAGLGVSPDNLDVVIGNGTHRPLSNLETEERVGTKIFEKYRIINHDALSGDLVVVGELPVYGPILINATVAQADFKMIVGSIYSAKIN
jgi:nickel-dependent lactate racemase